MNQTFFNTLSCCLKSFIFLIYSSNLLSSLEKNIGWGVDTEFLSTAKTYELEKIFNIFFIFKELFY